jgi:predicted nucleic acid-binding protein
MIVVDSNILAYLFIEGTHTEAAEALLTRDEDWAAPVLWRSELRSILTGCLRRGYLTLEEAGSIQSEAEDLMSGAEYEVDSGSVLGLVYESDCSAYDCEYVALAMRLRTKLVTMDGQVLSAFPDVAVNLALGPLT